MLGFVISSWKCPH
uniref:Uncharacterized protein n=1 Tax=Anguilla anguilla TaxID=7936 RepID=A0A0E9VG62_ANGAN